jgi:putative transposase
MRCGFGENMPRPRRSAPGGYVYHVLNRANARRRIFDTAGDYRAFEDILAEIQERIPMRILAWCVMPNHWHLVLWPREDGQLSDYLRLVTLTHTQRWHAFRRSAGTGHLYQGRFKSFIVQHDAHFLSVCRYVEANALRSNLVRRAEDWRWCSLSRRCRGRANVPPRIEAWPLPRPTDWIEYANQPASPPDLDSLRRCAQRGTPYGEKSWAEDAARRLGLEATLRRRGRPEKPAIEKVPGLC